MPAGDMPDRLLTRLRAETVLRPVAGAPDAAARPSLGRLRHSALSLIEGEALIEPAFVYRFVAIDEAEGGTLRLGARRLEAPWLLPERGCLSAVACCVATIGERLEARVRTLFEERRAALAVVLDGLGNELLFAVARIAQDAMLKAATRDGLAMAGELRAGDPGLKLEAQGTVLDLAGADAIGVRLSAGSMMHPTKSTSMVLGVGTGLPAVRWSRCDPCPSRPRCRIAGEAEARMPG